MYQYRKEVERIISNLDKQHAWQHSTNLYHSGLINLVQWNNLNVYIKKIKKGDN